MRRPGSCRCGTVFAGRQLPEPQPSWRAQQGVASSGRPAAAPFPGTPVFCTPHCIHNSCYHRALPVQEDYPGLREMLREAKLALKKSKRVDYYAVRWALVGCTGHTSLSLSLAHAVPRQRAPSRLACPPGAACP